MEKNSNRQALVASHMAKIVAVKNKIKSLNIDCNNIEDRIIKDQNKLKDSISKINTTCPIKTEEHWISWFNKVNVEGTLISVYDDIVNLKDATENAFNASFNTSITTLLFLQEIAEYELDLYSIIDESELTSAELSEIITTVLSDSDETDELVAKLFKQAQDKALRMKKRMDVFRDEINKTNRRITKWIILGSVITISISLVGSILISLYL